MAFRECAAKSSAFAKLAYAYTHREEAAKAAKAAGKRVIATLGCDVPEELLCAAGMMPYPIYALPGGNMEMADKYLEYAFDPLVRAQFQRIVDGSLNDFCDAVVVSNSTDVLVRTYLYLREMKRVETDVAFPPVYFIDWLFTRKRMHQERNCLVVSLFKEELEELAGRRIAEEDIRKAAVLCNRTRSLLRQVDSFRTAQKVQLTGAEMLVVCGSGFYMDREEYNKVLEELLAELPSWPQVHGRRIFYTGSVQTDTALYEEVEETGGIVVGEDTDWGDRYFDRDYNLEMPSTRALVDRYMLREFSSKKAFVSQRVDALNREVDKAKADSVLFYFHIYEEAASWDYPSQRESLEGRGIATAHFAKMHWPKTEEEQQAFSSDLRKLIAGEGA
ncbi:MAG: 2-hydroxyacyl-CoA dehydratase [Coriobacteriales bacterium]|nr:2-hydroxyacyl-CoA dehydratase [Coriobacteriales bacterium]